MRSNLITKADRQNAQIQNLFSKQMVHYYIPQEYDIQTELNHKHTQLLHNHFQKMGNGAMAVLTATVNIIISMVP